MRLAIMSDAHGNLPWFLKCFDSIRQQHCDAIYFLGDAVGYFEDGDAIFSLLREEGVICISGNHEEMLLGNVAYTEEANRLYHLERTHLKSENMDFIRALPSRISMRIGAKICLFMHAYPYKYTIGPNRARVYPEFERISEDVVFVGHTHRSCITRCSDKWIIDCGSIGQPRDIGNLSKYVLYDSNGESMTHVAVPQNVEDVLRTYPDMHEEVRACLYRKG